MTTATQSRANPYVGPRAFKYGETLDGRDTEVTDLLNLLIAERIVLFYSPSGAGKSSLIQAGLIGELEKEGFRVLPVMRPGLEPPPEALTQFNANRYLLSLLLSLEKTLPLEQQMPLADLTRLSLAEYLERRHQPTEKPGNEVLIFDQFEEILTLDPTDQEAKGVFFAQIGEALQSKNRWALFAMREEYAAGLDPYLRAIPTRLSSTLRLELLDLEAARQAIQEPAKRAGVEFTDAAADKLVKDLSTIYVQRMDGTKEELPGLYVEPVQLQVVCQRLWEKHPPEDLEIDVEDLQAFGDVSSALADFYADRVAAVASETGVPERSIRDWCQSQLFTEEGLRGQVRLGSKQSQGLDNKAIWALVKAHLVRADRRVGATWFELTHDRLVEPVRRNNEAWFKAHLSALQLQAKLWERQGSPDGLLLSGEALIEAERWAAENETQLQPRDRKFLDECRIARTRLERERRNARVFKGLFAVAALLAVIATLSCFYAISQARLARQQTSLAKAGQWASSAFANLNLDPERSILLALEAVKETIAVKEAPQASRRVRETAKDVLQVAENALHRATYTSRMKRTFVDPSGKNAHEQMIFQVCFNTPGTRLATVSLDKTVKIWEADSGKMLHSLKHEKLVFGASFNKDGSRLATACDDNTAKIWDVAGVDSGKIIKTLPHDKGVFLVSFNRGGTCLATACFDGTARLWDADKFEPLHSPLQHPQLRDLAFSPDGRFLATAGYGGEVKIWEVASGRELRTVKHGKALSKVSFSPDGTLLVTMSENDIVKIWDASSGTPLREFKDGEFKDMGYAFAFSPDNQRLAMVSSNDYSVHIRNISTGNMEAILPGHTNTVFKLVFLSQGESLGRFLVTCSADGMIKMWDTLSGQELFALAGHHLPVESIAVSPDEKRLVSVGWDGQARLWDIGVGHTGFVNTVAFDKEGTRLGTASYDGTARIWNTATGQELFRLKGHQGRINKLVFSPDKKKLVTAGNDGTLKFWDAGNGANLNSVPVYTRAINIVFSPGGKFLAAHLGLSTQNSKILLLELSSEKLSYRYFEGYNFCCLATSPDEKQMITGLGDGNILVWDLDGKREPKVVPGHKNYVFSVAYSPDGDYLASAGMDGTVKLWNTKSWENQKTLTGFDSLVASVAFSPDGKQIAAGSMDKTAKVYDLTGNKLHTFNHPAAIGDVAFSPDGKKLATACYDNRWYIHPLDLEEAVGQAKEVVTRKLTPEECCKFRVTCPPLPGPESKE